MNSCFKGLYTLMFQPVSASCRVLAYSSFLRNLVSFRFQARADRWILSIPAMIHSDQSRICLPAFKWTVNKFPAFCNHQFPCVWSNLCWLAEICLLLSATIKVIVVGNGGVGKSSMIRRFCTGEYTGGRTILTYHQTK